MKITILLILFYFKITVPVGLWTSTTLPPLISDGTSEEQTSTTAVMDPSAMPEHGCEIDGKFYMDGMQVCIVTIPTER